jgi:FkbM family methyltransferase
MRIRKSAYYAASALALVSALDTRSRVALGVPRRRRRISLRSGLTLHTDGLLDLLVLKEAVLDDCYGIRALAASVDAKTIVDVGAGVGCFAVLAAATFPSASVIAFEPNPSSFRLLEANRRANRADNLTLVASAVATSPMVELHVGRDGALASTRHAAKGARVLQVPAVRLDDALADVGLIDLLKVDCEGGELDVLESAKTILNRIQRIVVEFHCRLLPEADVKVATLLAEHGFAPTVVPDPYEPRVGYVTGRRE